MALMTLSWADQYLVYIREGVVKRDATIKRHLKRQTVRRMRRSANLAIEANIASFAVSREELEAERVARREAKRAAAARAWWETLAFLSKRCT